VNVKEAGMGRIPLLATLFLAPGAAAYSPGRGAAGRQGQPQTD
jgi:hypothetical protein